MRSFADGGDGVAVREETGLLPASRASRRISAAVLVLILVLLSACAQEKKREVKRGDKAIILTATIWPVQEADVNAPLTGLVSQVAVEPGQRVQAKQMVIRLDPTPYRAAVLGAEAALANARANLAKAESGASQAELAEARAEVERLRQEVDRQRRLAALPATAADYERSGIVLDNAKARLERVYSLFGRGLASRPEIEAAENDYAEAWQRYRAAAETIEIREAVRDSDVRIAEARLQAARARLAGLEAGGTKQEPIDSARARVGQAEADLSRAQYILAQTDVLAPISGIVTEVKAQVGERADERALLLSIKDIDSVQVKADLSPGLLPHVQPGRPAKVTVNTVPPTTVSAAIHRIQPVADAKTQSLGLSLILPNPGLRFQPGFTARVEIPLGGPPAVGLAR